MNNEIMVVSDFTTTLKNPELKEITIDILKATASAVTAEKTIVTGLYTVLTDDLWEEDFESMTQYAEALGYSKGYLSQVKRAGHFYEMLPDDAEDYSKVSSGTAYEYGAFKTFEEFLKFVEYCDSEKKPVLVGAKRAHELVADYKKYLDAIVVTDAKEVTDGETEGETETDSETEGDTPKVEKIITHVAYKGKDYTIEIDEDILKEWLKAYSVKSEKIKQ